MNKLLENKKVSVLMGGPGSEREVSLRSAENVVRGLQACGAEVSAVDVRDPGFILPVGTDLAYLMIHGTYGEDGDLQALLERRGVAYTGEGVEESRVAFDKILSKQAFARAGVSTPAWEILAAGQRPSLQLPLVIKAPRQGSSVGVYLCRDEAQLEQALTSVISYSSEILVEQLVDGLELTVGVLGEEPLPIVMIQGSYDYERKYPWSEAARKAREANPQQQEAAHACPAPISTEDTRRVQQLALEACRALGLQVYSRVDILLESSSGRAHVLEANTIPGMTESSLLPEAALVAGICLEQLLTRIAELSFKARPLVLKS